jgi:hypothetical protein
LDFFPSQNFLRPEIAHKLIYDIMFLGLLCALEIREEKLLHEPKDIAKSQDYKVLERLFEELTKCKEDDQQREFSLDIHFVVSQA